MFEVFVNTENMTSTSRSLALLAIAKSSGFKPLKNQYFRTIPDPEVLVNLPNSAQFNLSRS